MKTEIKQLPEQESVETTKEKEQSKSNEIWLFHNDLHLTILVVLLFLTGLFHLLSWSNLFPLKFSYDILNLSFSITALVFIRKDVAYFSEEVSDKETSSDYFIKIKNSISTIFFNPKDNFTYLKQRSNKLQKQFIFHLSFLWVSWIIFYAWHLFYLINTYEEANPLIIKIKSYFNPVDNIENINNCILYFSQNLGNTIFLMLFMILYTNSISTKEVIRGSELQFKKINARKEEKSPFLFWSVYSLFIVLSIAISISLYIWEDSHSIIALITIFTGIFGCLALSLFVGRIIDNGFNNKKYLFWIIPAALYFYGQVRAFYPMILTEQVHVGNKNFLLDHSSKEYVTSSLIIIAFYLKVILFLTIKWLMCSKRFIFLIWERLLEYLSSKNTFNEFKENVD